MFDWLKRFFEYLFSLLRKESVVQGREEKVEKKEQKDFLNQLIDTINAVHQEEKVKKYNLELSKYNSELMRLVMEFIFMIEMYLQDKKAEHLQDSSERLALISSLASKITPHWEKMKKREEKVVGPLEKALEQAKGAGKKLTEEKKLLRREARILKRMYRKSKRKGLDLKEIQDKAVIIKKKRKINVKLIELNNKAENNLQGITTEVKVFLIKINNLLKAGEKVLPKLGEKARSWKNLLQTLKGVKDFVILESNLIAQFGALSSKSTKSEEKAKSLLEETNKLMKEKKTLDREYEHFLVKEKEEFKEAAGKEGPGIPALATV